MPVIDYLDILTKLTHLCQIYLTYIPSLNIKYDIHLVLQKKEVTIDGDLSDPPGLWGFPDS